MPAHNKKVSEPVNFKIPVNGREVALQVLRQVWHDSAYSAIALNRVLRTVNLEEADRRFATELANGAIKAKGTLDFLLRQIVDRSVSKLEPVIYCILQLGLYQIFYMDRIPDFAVCDESVRLSRKFSHKGADRFVNGVLRGTLRKKSELWKMVQQDTALRFNHPRWLLERWERKFGDTETEALCRWDNEPAPLSLRVNTVMTTRDAFLQDLREVGCEAEVSLWSPDGVIITKSSGISALLQYFPHSFYVQDESSMLPAQVLKPQPGECILDMCSAPGGKATHMASMMEGRGEVIACDIYPHKLKLIAENAHRLKLDNIHVELQDGSVFREEWRDKFDRVLVDAPCSGLGVLRRRAEARWTKTEAGLSGFPPLQRSILENAAVYVKPGGMLLYSSCTMEEEENERLTGQFLLQNPEWTQVGFSHPRTGEMIKDLQLYPQRDGVDGFYLTLLRKGIR